LGLGKYYLNLEDYDKSLEFFSKGFDSLLNVKPEFFYEKLNADISSIHLQYGIAESYYKKGDIFQAKEEIGNLLKLIQLIPPDGLHFIEKMQWFEDKKTLSEKILLLKNELEL
jgi:tetratricopeptide (TPR) repeat protein